MSEYHVWAFRKHYSCYDCGDVEKINVDLNASAITMDEETFVAFSKGVQLTDSSSYVYLYRVSGDNALADHVKNVIETGRQFIAEEKQRNEDKKRRAAEREARAKEKAAKEAEKAAEEERKLYEKLKEKFGK